MNKNDQLKAIHELWGHLNPWQRKWLRIQGEVVYLFVISMKVLHRVDLWLFPPAAFYGAYNLAAQQFPPHPMKLIAVLSTAFMFSAFVLLVIRPVRRKIHWVRP